MMCQAPPNMLPSMNSFNPPRDCAVEDITSPILWGKKLRHTGKRFMQLGTVGKAELGYEPKPDSRVCTFTCLMLGSPTGAKAHPSGPPLPNEQLRILPQEFLSR